MQSYENRDCGKVNNPLLPLCKFFLFFKKLEKLQKLLEITECKVYNIRRTEEFLFAIYDMLKA